MKVVLFVVLVALPLPGFSENLVAIDEIGKLFGQYVQRSLKTEDEVIFNQALQLMHGSFNTLEELGPNRNTLLCLACRSVAQAVFDVIENGGSDEELTDTITTLCTSLGIMTSNVCRGAVKLNVPILTYIVKNTPEASPRTFCGLILQSNENPNECPFDDPRFEWTVDLPDPPSDTTHEKVINTNEIELKVAIIADAHIDPLYEAYGVANCDEPTCCRVGQKEAAEWKYRSDLTNSVIDDALVKSNDTLMLDLDYVGKIERLMRYSRNRQSKDSKPAGYWGDFRNCDTPLWAFDDLIERIAEAHKDVDMVYYMGDTIDHGVWETSNDLIDEMNAYFIEKLKKELGPNIPIIPIIGNHESQPTNQFAPARIAEPGLDTRWLYEALANKWADYLDEQAIDSLLERGEYSLSPKPGLRVITLNTNVAYVFNWWLLYDPQDSKKHLDWLIEELYKAEQAGEVVHILSHIPPGVGDLTKTWTREYNRIINRFSSIIKAEFNGHRHGDEFKIFFSLNDHTPINMAWIIGSSTAYSNYNLNYKIASFNSNTYELLNFENYIYNLTEANLTPHRRPHWFQLYDFRNSFNLDSLSPENINGLVNKMATTDKHLLDLYAAYQSKLSDNLWPYCDHNCKVSHLCRTVITELWVRGRCEELISIYNANNIIN